MATSQKYSIVAFLQPLPVGAEFPSNIWPPHVDIANVFTLDTIDSHEQSFKKIAQNTSPIRYTSIGKAPFVPWGEGPDTLLEPTPEILKLHNEIVSYIYKSGGEFTAPKLQQSGYQPRIPRESIPAHTTGELTSLALVDLFTGGDTNVRKIIWSYDFPVSREL